MCKPRVLALNQHLRSVRRRRHLHGICKRAAQTADQIDIDVKLYAYMCPHICMHSRF